MKDISLICSNSFTNQYEFTKYNTIDEELPTCKIEETKEFYYININSFYGNKHILELCYKHNFLILNIKLKNPLTNSSYKQIFYLLDIDLNNILLHDHKHNVKLIIPKII